MRLLLILVKMFLGIQWISGDADPRALGVCEVSVFGVQWKWSSSPELLFGFTTLPRGEAAPSEPYLCMHYPGPFSPAGP